MNLKCFLKWTNDLRLLKFKNLLGEHVHRSPLGSQLHHFSPPPPPPPNLKRQNVCPHLAPFSVCSPKESKMPKWDDQQCSIAMRFNQGRLRHVEECFRCLCECPGQLTSHMLMIQELPKSPKSVIFATREEVRRMFLAVKSRWTTRGYMLCR